MKLFRKISVFIILVYFSLFYKVQVEGNPAGLAQAAVSSPVVSTTSTTSTTSTSAAIAPPVVSTQTTVTVAAPATPAQNITPAGTAVTQTGALSQPASTASTSTQGVIEPMPSGMNGRISLDLRNIEVTDALKFLSMS